MFRVGSIWLVVSLFHLVLCVPVKIREKEELNCGYKTCNPTKEGHINLHLVPHSHDDVGWVKTVDQYYNGVHVGHYDGAVKKIYDSVLKSLKKSRDRKFIAVETAFFWRWWQDQDVQNRTDFRKLVLNGQIEFTGGGWAMNDEAVTHYQSTIDQMSWGLRRLNDTFGECGRPKMGWQIDPFGHSSEMASIFAGLGYDGVILGRIDYQDHVDRIHSKNLDFVWRSSKSLGPKSDIFTSILFNRYDAPSQFCFEANCRTEPLVDDVNSDDYNIHERSRSLLNSFVQYAIKSYSSNNLLIPMGKDFAYENAEVWYVNMDKLIKYINKVVEFDGFKYNVMYSTPSCYVYAVYNETKGVLSSKLKTDDFFPYASDPDSYWTGYYTSRPQIKRFERMANNFLQVSKQLFALGSVPISQEPNLNSLREAIGVLQHHDAITGTEKRIVANDYERILSAGVAKSVNVTDAALKNLINPKHPKFDHCMLANISQCEYSESSDTFVVTVYNPSSRFMNKYVRLPVLGTSYKVTGPTGKELQTQIMPIHSRLLKMPGRTSKVKWELIFKAADVPPLGFKSFFIKKQLGDNVIKYGNGSTSIHYEKISMDLDPKNHFKGTIHFTTLNVSMDLNQTFEYYTGFVGYRPSGAYIFRPNPKKGLKKVAKKVKSNTLYVGPLVTELHQVYNDIVSQTVRIYKDEPFVEFDWIVGSLPPKGIEIITKYSTHLKTDKTFYTDSNGREMLKRVLNYRPTWKIDLSEPKASNYYPVTSKITLKDEKRNLQFSVLTDRAQGGSSLEDGEVELMLHRNTVQDDSLGVDENLEDLAYGTGVVVRGCHYVLAGHINPPKHNQDNVDTFERLLAQQKLLDAWIFLSVPTEGTFKAYSAANDMQFSGLKVQLPSNVHILTLEPWHQSDELLLRLEHIFAENEDPELAKPVTINLQDLFAVFKVVSLRETTLGGNQWLDENSRFHFSTNSTKNTLENKKIRVEDKFHITLSPMQIRTFIIKTVPRLKPDDE